ncbi:MAG: hypothetical protein ACTSYM_05830 [Candidatus Baldrarchaeia archaeon]
MGKVNINVKLEKAVHDFLVKLTKILGVTKSEIVRQALIYYFKDLKTSSVFSSLKEIAENAKGERKIAQIKK